MSKELEKSSSFFSTNIVFIEELYQKYSKNPALVDESWADFFAANEDEIQSVLADYQGPSWARRDLQVIGSPDFDMSTFAKREISKKAGKKAASTDGRDLNLRVANLILAYKRFGHLVANLDPLELTKKQYVAELELQNHGITDADLSAMVDLNGILGLQKAKVSEVIERLEFVYSGSVGTEFEYIRDQEQRDWLAAQTENTMVQGISQGEKVKILKEIVRTEGFEQFLHKRFPGAKRFSVEGGDASINSVEKIIDVAAKHGVKKVVLGMAHRGRLNTLTGVMGKPYHQMIAEFKGIPGIPESVTKSGDVKYHMGYSNSREIAGNKIDLSLAFNPSHLEAVNPVAAGRVRAIQDQYQDHSRSQALTLLLHGDAAFAGQGSVAETLMMNGIDGYDTGGVMHVIINNQIGFTANPTDSRSTHYSSDLAKAIDAPIFHVNGDDVEAVVKVSDIATRYRQKFGKDVVLDIVCYRRYGHNEGDEPFYTQPVMYTKIKSHPTLEKIYSQKLISENAISQEEYKKIAADFLAHLNAEFDIAQDYKAKEGDWLKEEWSDIKNLENEEVKTAVDAKTLKDIAHKITQVPEGFNINKKIAKQLDLRRSAVDSEENIDWGCAESLAFASLLNEGFPVRITGQDAGRGTFSHRHAVLHDSQTAARHSVFNELEGKAKYEVFDSILSEYAVLGYEYGFSLSAPYTLTIWEAQFGDFANGAQIIFDQFIASSEVKWLRKSGLVMLLPHGYEGQGPEHSSARLERYLQACADNNLRVCNITTPANFFHALRRQIHSKDRKPLVVMSPKSVLRNKLAVSSLDDFAKTESFKTLIPETNKLVSDAKVRKVILCSGKVYYDLVGARQEKEINDVAIIRLEQLYPFPKEELKSELKKYKNAQVVWCQEEPRNMGSWKFVDDLIEEALVESKHKTLRPTYAGRVACASPATGYASYHAKEQKNLVDEALK